MRTWVLAFCLVATIAGSRVGPARANPGERQGDADARVAESRARERIVVASGDLAFRAALAEALAPAGMDVVVAEDSPPSALGDMASSSRALADRERASATVWLVTGTSAATLVTYDRDVDRLLIRSLPYAPPLAAARAIEVARMTRTMLRALRVTPDTEQLPPRAEDAPAVRASAIGADAGADSVATRNVLALELDAGVRVLGPGAAAALAGTIGVAWRPGPVELALAASLSPASGVQSGGFMGDISDRSLAVLVRRPMSPAPSLAVAGIAGAAVHVIELDGALDGTAVRARRFDPAMRAGISSTYELGPNLATGVVVYVDWLLRRQVYEAGPREILVVPLVQVYAGLVISARVL